MTKIKICGLTRVCDIEAVNTVMPDYIGFVFAKSPRQVSPAQALEMRRKLSPGIIPVGVFVNEKPENIQLLVSNGVIEAVQLHGSEDEAYIEKIKTLTSRQVIKAISVEKTGDVQKWRSTCADYLLLDKNGGGTGKVFDWNLIGAAVKPFFLAGGLSADNIQAAIDKINPFAVDVSSGVETDGLKDSQKIISLLRRIRNA